MSLKCFRIEQLCPSIDSMVSLVFVHDENHVQYVHSKRDEPPLVTQFKSFLIVSTKTGKKSLKINNKRHFRSAWNDI